MKKLLFLTLLLASCSGGSTYLSKERVESEQHRCVTYFDNRSSGFPFSSRFYQITDSISTGVFGNDARTFELIYSEIQDERFNDSTGSKSGDWWKHVAVKIDRHFNIAKGGRK